ncbi:PilX N-terminal domain-containing pilus assembly protein [Variovorax sp. dw_954]|uniref:pilus assembly PilX family protein n=1 Tax=Variovorax sp. dw_954 TaxID=2720078 RepID=UPI001BD392A3|nr:PilX N-terminal domain-containing pilus assembly protein [Variovorax sp. dw_954]
MPRSRAQRRQRGISLFLVMMFLIILSILGITAIQSSSLSARIAGNEADRTLAFQAAESALRDAEKDIKGACVAPACRSTPIAPETADQFDSTCALGLCLPDATTPVWELKDNWSIAGRAATYGDYTGAKALPAVAQQPKYLIEYFKLGESFVYRVSATGYGAIGPSNNPTTHVLLQTTVKALK